MAAAHMPQANLCDNLKPHPKGHDEITGTMTLWINMLVMYVCIACYYIVLSW